MFNLTQTYKNIDQALKQSNFNIFYAVKFFQSETSINIAPDDFMQIINWINIKLDQAEIDQLMDSLRNSNKQINSEKFLRKIRIAHFSMVNIILQ